MYMGEVDLPSGRDATAPRHQTIPPTANMVRSAGQAVLRVGEGEDRAEIGHQADAQDGRDDGRWLQEPKQWLSGAVQSEAVAAAAKPERRPDELAGTSAACRFGNE